jgi:hypothetical protein
VPCGCVSLDLLLAVELCTSLGGSHFLELIKFIYVNGTPHVLKLTLLQVHLTSTILRKGLLVAAISLMLMTVAIVFDLSVLVLYH